MNPSEKSCIICGTPLHGRSDRTTCGDACRVRLCRQRQTESLEETSEDVGLPTTGHYAPSDLPWLEEQPPINAISGHRNRWNEQVDQVDEVEQKRSNEAALAKEVHQHYTKVVSPFLQKDNVRLQPRQLRRMLMFTTDAYEDYKLHPHLAQPDSIAKKRLKDLRDIILLLQETYQESKTNWSNTGKYELTNKWRRQLYERSLD